MQQAREVIQALRSGYDEEAWLAVATPINDTLRESRRAALVSYVLTEKSIVDSGVETADQLFEYFLIDVSMSACMLDVAHQAGASARCSCSCSAACSTSSRTSASTRAIDRRWRDWKWMKNYRVWEANRKVFLYPENWIEPELRDDKTPFFKELENELLQNEVTHEYRRAADCSHYLEKLDVVARLEFVGMYRSRAGEGTARRSSCTSSAARGTRRTATSIGSTARERPLDAVDEGRSRHRRAITSFPVVWNRRLYLFWPVFEPKPDPDNITLDEGQEPRQMIEIRLAWSEYRDGRWSGKTLGKSEPLFVRVFNPVNFHDPAERLPFVRLVPTIGSDLQIKAFVWSPRMPVFWFWLRVGTFTVRGCGGNVHAQARRYDNLDTVSDGLSLMRPASGMWPLSMRFVEFNILGSEPFAILRGAPPDDEHTYQDLQELDSERTLAKTPATLYTVLPPPVDHFLEGHPFVFQDGPRSYLVTVPKRTGASSKAGCEGPRWPGLSPRDRPCEGSAPVDHEQRVQELCRDGRVRWCCHSSNGEWPGAGTPRTDARGRHSQRKRRQHLAVGQSAHEVPVTLPRRVRGRPSLPAWPRTHTSARSSRRSTPAGSRRFSRSILSV